MATLQELEEANAKREQQMMEARKRLSDKYGVVLGEAVFDYAYKDIHTEEENSDNRSKLAEAVLRQLGESQGELKILAIEALLEACEARIAPVAQQAHDADIRTMVVG